MARPWKRFCLQKPDPARLAHIQQLLREVPLIDGPNDLPWQYRTHGNDMGVFDLARDTKKMELVTDLPRLTEGCVGE